MATVPADVDEYVKVDGLPLDTHAWETLDLAALYDSTPVTGSNVDLAYHPGQKPRRRWPGPKRVELGIRVFGNVDSDGNPTTSLLGGLRRNLDELKQVLRPRLFDTGTALLVHELDDGGSRTARCQVVAPLQTSGMQGVAVNGVVDLLVPDGVLRSSQQTTASGSSSSGAAFNLTVDNPGSATQLATVISLSGTATSVLIESNGLSGVQLDVQVDLNNGDVTVDTDVFTVQQGGNDMHGNVSAAGHERWLPLEPGGDTWTVTPTGGDVTVDVEHFAPWS